MQSSGVLGAQPVLRTPRWLSLLPDGSGGGSIARMREVRVDALQLERLERILPPARVERLRTHAGLAAEGLRGRVVWNVNATAQGGGVAEMLR